MTIIEGPVDTDNFDLSNLRGAAVHIDESKQGPDDSGDDDLMALAELVPDLRNRKNSLENTHNNGMTLGDEPHPPGGGLDGGAHINATGDNINRIDSMGVHAGKTEDQKMSIMPRASYVEGVLDSSSSDDYGGRDVNEALEGNDELKEDVDSDEALSSDHSKPRPPDQVSESLELGGDFQNISSAQSLSTATQTHEVRMPMYLPTFKPATGCTNASDFIVRCFVARLRSGITVVKHGRSRWCKSRLRILHIHPDGRSLSWKPAQGEPTSSKRPPKLDLTTCLEVRHAWSPDPQNPMYTGTPILRQKCEAANAHKSFALIFPKRTVDITSVTADQCKVLMEGFSALCFRLQVANLAGKGGKKGAQKMPEEEEVATTASVTLTNNSTLSPHNRR